MLPRLAAKESQTPTEFNASIICILEAVFSGSAFCLMVPGNRNGSWLRQLMRSRIDGRETRAISCPSMRIWPELISFRRRIDSANVLLPLFYNLSILPFRKSMPSIRDDGSETNLPVLPQRPNFFPADIFRLIPLSKGFVSETFQEMFASTNSISP